MKNRYWTESEEKLCELTFLKGERWKPIPVFYDYFVSDHGRVASTKRAKAIILKPQKSTVYGTVHYSLSKNGKLNTRLGHRLVLASFKGPCPEGHEGSHLDGNAKNNHIDNLAWETPLVNTRRKVDHGTQIYGSVNVCAKLKESDIPIIRMLRKQGLVHRVIAKRFNVHRKLIGDILAGKRWTHV